MVGAPTFGARRRDPQRVGRWRHILWTLIWGSGAGLLIAHTALRFSVGGWPPHDTVAYVFAGSHLVHGEPVYANAMGGFLGFWYGPPWAVLWGPLSMLSPYASSAALFALQVLALRYVAGSWKAAFALGWLPPVRTELITGNVDLLLAATILASVREVRGAGWAVALFAFAKFSPVLLLVASSWRQRREAALAGLVLLSVTLPVAFLWPAWIGALQQASTGWRRRVDPVRMAAADRRGPDRTAQAVGHCGRHRARGAGILWALARRVATSSKARHRVPPLRFGLGSKRS